MLDRTTELCNRLVTLKKRKENAKAELAAIEKEYESVSVATVNAFVENGIQNRKAVSGEMIHIRRTIYASKISEVPQDVVCDALNRNGLGFLVKTACDTAGLKSWIREQEEEKGPHADGPKGLLPEDLRPFINVFEETSAVVTGAKGGLSDG